MTREARNFCCFDKVFEYSLCFINPLVSQFLYLRLRDLRVFNLSGPKHLLIGFSRHDRLYALLQYIRKHAKLCAISLMRKCSDVFSLMLSFSPH